MSGLAPRDPRPDARPPMRAHDLSHIHIGSRHIGYLGRVELHKASVLTLHTTFMPVAKAATFFSYTARVSTNIFFIIGFALDMSNVVGQNDKSTGENVSWQLGSWSGERNED